MKYQRKGQTRYRERPRPRPSPQSPGQTCSSGGRLRGGRRQRPRPARPQASTGAALHDGRGHRTWNMQGGQPRAPGARTRAGRWSPAPGAPGPPGSSLGGVGRVAPPGLLSAETDGQAVPRVRVFPPPPAGAVVLVVPPVAHGGPHSSAAHRAVAAALAVAVGALHGQFHAAVLLRGPRGTQGWRPAWTGPTWRPAASVGWEPEQAGATTPLAGPRGGLQRCARWPAARVHATPDAPGPTAGHCSHLAGTPVATSRHRELPLPQSFGNTRTVGLFETTRVHIQIRPESHF